MRRRAFLAGALASTAAQDAFAQQTPRKKMALVIGNGDYDGDGRADPSPEARMRAQARGYVGDLPNAWFDAVRVGEALRRAGFEVQTFNNVDRTMMAGVISTHQSRAAAEKAGRRYVGERGFGAMSAPQRTIICFSTQPGELAADGMTAASSPFAAAISRRLREGAVIDDLLSGVMGEVAAASGARQTPWIRGRLGDGTKL